MAEVRYDNDNRSGIGACGADEVAWIQQGGLDEPPMIKTRKICPIAA